MTPIRLLVADDHVVLRAGLRMLLDVQHDITVAGEAGDGAEVLRKARELQPDVVLMDLTMPGPPSGDVIREVLRACPQTRVLVLTMHDDPAYLASAMAAGRKNKRGGGGGGARRFVLRGGGGGGWGGGGGGGGETGGNLRANRRPVSPPRLDLH